MSSSSPFEMKYSIFAYSFLECEICLFYGQTQSDTSDDLKISGGILI